MGNDYKELVLVDESHILKSNKLQDDWKMVLCQAMGIPPKYFGKSGFTPCPNDAIDLDDYDETTTNFPAEGESVN